MQSRTTSIRIARGRPCPLGNNTARDESPRVSRMHKDERVIIIAPVGQDAVAMADLLRAEGFETQICQGLDECSREITDSAGALLLTEERERRRIAQVLHDDLQQVLVAARFYLRALGETKSAAKRDGIMQEIDEMLERSFKLTRSLSLELSPPVLHQNGLAAALEWL